MSKELYERNQKVIDGWENVIAGIGGKQDKRKSTQYGSYEYIGPEELANIYIGDGIGTRIIDAPVDDMTREWVRIGDTSVDNAKKIQKKLTELGAEKKINEAIKWSDLFGGSIIVLGAMDGKDIEKPMGNVNSIEWLTVINVNDIDLTTSSFNDNPRSPTFGRVIAYNVQFPTDESLSRVEYRQVHASRVIEFKGAPAPDRSAAYTQDQRYWGFSRLQFGYERLRDFGGFVSATSNLMLELVIGVYKFKDLTQLLAAGNEAGLLKRLEVINQSKSMINGIILDKDEDFIRSTANVSGIPELFDRWCMLISGIYKIPVSKLFSKAASGLNANDTGARDNYYDDVKARSRLDFVPAVQKLVNIIADTLNIDMATVVANPLVQLTPTEEATLEKTKAETDKLQAETDKINIESQIYDAAYVQERDKIKLELSRGDDF